MTPRENMTERGKRFLNLLFTEERRKRWSAFCKDRLRSKWLSKEFKATKSDLEELYRVCSEYISPVTCPLVLISQVQRSGGSLLSQLFDGHPEIHAHPHELKIGYPKKYIWPIINLNDSPERWFEILFEDVNIRLLGQGYKKVLKHEEIDESFLFLFLPGLQKRIFLKHISSIESATRRDVFDAYMTSYFGAWLNNQNKLGVKKLVTAFTPRLTMEADNAAAFFQIYPEGRLISLVRDPKNWYPSAYRHDAGIKRQKYVDIRGAIDQWSESAQAMLRNKRIYGDKVCIIRFEDLVSKTKSVMQYVAEFLDIEFQDILLVPTFNKYPIRANTSFEQEDHGILNSTLTRYKTLSDEQLDIIETMTREIYPAVLAKAVDF